MKAFLPVFLILSCVLGLRAGADDFYVSCLNDNSIIKISHDTVSVFTTGKAPFWGLAVDGQGNLYVSSEGDDAILKYPCVAGKLSNNPTVFAGDLHGPLGIAFDHAGNLYESERSGNINKFINTGGALSNVCTPFIDGSPERANLRGNRLPDALAFDPDGNLYVAIEIGGILRFTNSVTGLATMPDEKPFSTVSRAREMAFDRNGNLYTANHLSGENYVYEYLKTATGLSSTPVVFYQGRELNGPYGLTIDSSGNLYVTNWGYYHGTEILEFPCMEGLPLSQPFVYGTDFHSPIVIVATKSL